jgi:hypothetical protein
MNATNEDETQPTRGRVAWGLIKSLIVTGNRLMLRWFGRSEGAVTAVGQLPGPSYTAHDDIAFFKGFSNRQMHKAPRGIARIFLNPKAVF